MGRVLAVCFLGVVERFGRLGRKLRRWRKWLRMVRRHVGLGFPDGWREMFGFFNWPRIETRAALGVDWPFLQKERVMIFVLSIGRSQVRSWNT